MRVKKMHVYELSPQYIDHQVVYSLPWMSESMIMSLLTDGEFDKYDEREVLIYSKIYRK